MLLVLPLANEYAVMDQQRQLYQDEDAAIKNSHLPMTELWRGECRPPLNTCMSTCWACWGTPRAIPGYPSVFRPPKLQRTSQLKCFSSASLLLHCPYRQAWRLLVEITTSILGPATWWRRWWWLWVSFLLSPTVKNHWRDRTGFSAISVSHSIKQYTIA